MGVRKIAVRRTKRSNINVVASIEAEAVMCEPQSVQSKDTPSQGIDCCVYPECPLTRCASFVYEGII